MHPPPFSPSLTVIVHFALYIITAGHAVNMSDPSGWNCNSYGVGPNNKLVAKTYCPGAPFTELRRCNSLRADQCEADSSCVWAVNTTSLSESMYQANMNASFGYLNK